MAAKRVSIFGATGSIGRSTVDLIARAPDDYAVEVLTAHRDVTGLAQTARRLRARSAVIAEPLYYHDLKDALADTGIEVAAGSDALVEAAGRPVDWAMSAIVGSAGLMPTMAAIKAGATIALANKETLVCAGPVVTAAVQKAGTRLIPVDSEHNAIFQCFDHAQPERVSRVILTASGGPFRHADFSTMRDATPEQAVAHPTWSMGAKISVDSATLMNKGLELIEAKRLFPISAAQLDVLVHPQSVVHSMVEYVDGSVLAQMGTPDMRTPIAYALAWPERMPTPCERLDLARIGRLEFEAPDEDRFPALALAKAALAADGARPTVLNAANEVAVAAFLARQIGFLDIPSIVSETLNRYDPRSPSDIDEVLAIDAEARSEAQQAIGRLN